MYLDNVDNATNAVTNSASFRSITYIPLSNVAMGSLAPPLLDAVVIGAGFSGLYVLKQLRDKGFSVEAFELLRKGGGVWCVFRGS